MPLISAAMKSAALAAALGLSASAVLAQGAMPSPQSPGNQIPAPGNTQPSDPAANANPAARVPTAPEDRKATTGAGAGAAGGTAAGTTGAGGATSPSKTGDKNDSPSATPLSPAESGGPRPGGGTGAGSSN